MSNISKPSHDWFRKCLLAYSVPINHLNQYWFIDNWTIRNTFQWNSNQNKNIFIVENDPEDVNHFVLASIYLPTTLQMKVSAPTLKCK